MLAIHDMAADLNFSRPTPPSLHTILRALRDNYSIFTYARPFPLCYPFTNSHSLTNQSSPRLNNTQTDVHAVDGDWPAPTKLPLIPGHEGAGVVIAVGPGVTGVKPGDRVGIPWLHSSCGNCEFCLSGHETLCPNQETTGYSVDGCFAEFTLAPASHVARIPDAVSFEQVRAGGVYVFVWKGAINVCVCVLSSGGGGGKVDKACGMQQNYLKESVCVGVVKDRYIYT